MAVDPEKVPPVQQSLGRCLLNKKPGKDFLDAFYDTFLASDPRIKPLFAKTDMKKQKDLLRQGLITLIMYANGSGLAKSSVEQLAVKHDRQHVNIDPALYPLWVKSLMDCIKRYNPKYDPELHKLWTAVLDRGISVMKKAY
jgi:hemoglobin-like flavoprotein